MPQFIPYSPDQALLLPPHVRDVLGADHICFFIHEVVQRMDLSSFEKEYGEEGRRAYAPAMMLKVWLYAYALQMHSSRRLAQRIGEDLPLRFLAGGLQPDHWTLNEFRKRHPGGVNDAFTQVLEWGRQQGLVKLGYVAIDSTRIAANASRDEVDNVKSLRRERARLRRAIRRWQKQCDREAVEETPGNTVPMERLQERLASIPQRLERLKKSGREQLSRSDGESRFLRDRRGFTLGYTGEIAVNEDHVIVAQRVTQNSSDNQSLVPMVEEVEKQCGARPARVGADTGFFSNANLVEMEQRSIEAYLPDPQMAYEMRSGRRARGIGRSPVRNESLIRMRQKLRSPEGRREYFRRQQTVEPVFGILKEQRGLRRFRRRGLAAVGVEFTFACAAYNLTRLHRNRFASKA
jgi:transposase